MRASRLVVTALACASLVAACSESPELLPAGPQGNPATGSVGAPAPGENDDTDPDASLLTGRICPVEDLSLPTLCAPRADLSGIVVATLDGSVSTTTGNDGSFVLDISDIATPEQQVLQATADELGFRPSLIPIDLSGGGVLTISLPIVDAAYFDTLLLSLDVPLPQETGTMAIYPTFMAQPLPGVTIENVSAASGIFYDNGSALNWIEAATTGDLGAALVFGLNQPSADFTALDLEVLDTIDVRDVPIGADTVTFIEVVFE